MAQLGSKLIHNSFLLVCSFLLCEEVWANATLAASATPPKEDSAHCSASHYQSAETKAFKIRSWADYYSWYRLHAACDEGEVGERISDVTEKLLGTDWNGFQKQAGHIATSKGVSAFIIRNISSVSDGSLMTAIAEQARTRCAPADKHSLSLMQTTCVEIEKKARYIADGGN